MKRTILFIFTLVVGLFACQTLSAQEVWKMEVKRTDGTTTSIPVSEIKDVTFVKEVTEVPNEPSITPAEAIDLGLSVKWASHNVGASKPEDYGGYYAWGETEEKADYDRDTYQYYQNGSYVHIGDNICGTKYDVAHVKWGGSWRMPSKEEMKELNEKCSWEWTSYNGTNGYIVTGPNGNSIFRPAAGSRYGTGLYYAGAIGFYWSGLLSEEGEDYAYSLDFNISGNHYWDGWLTRYDGHSVRPVSD